MNANCRRMIEMKKLTSNICAIFLLRCCERESALESSGVIIVRAPLLDCLLNTICSSLLSPAAEPGKLKQKLLDCNPTFNAWKYLFTNFQFWLFSGLQ